MKNKIRKTGGKLYRAFSADVRTDDGSELIELSVSSDIAYRRGREYEVLDHSPEAVDLSRLNAGAAVLVDHGGDQLGVVERAWLDGNKLRVQIRFSKANEYARIVEQDIRDGIRRNVSIGYLVNAWDDPKERQLVKGLPVFRAVDWTVFEVSIVAVPADYSVGAGRELDDEDEGDVEASDEVAVEAASEDGEAVAEAAEEVEEITEKQESETISVDSDEKLSESESSDVVMNEDATDAAEDAESIDEASDDVDDLEETSTGRSVAVTVETRTMNKELIAKLQLLATRSNMTDRLPEWIAEGRSYEAACAEVMDVRDNSEAVTHPGTMTVSRKEQDEVSFAKAFRALREGGDSLLNEMGKTAARAAGINVEANTLYIPMNAPIFKRAAAFGNTGANLAADQYVSFEQTLREVGLAASLGVDIQNVNGIVTLPRFTTPPAVVWASETGSVADQDVAFESVQWTPKRAVVRIPFSEMLGMLNREYDIENVLRDDIQSALAEGFEAAVFSGTGANGQPTGLLNDAAIPALAGSGSFSLARAMEMRSTAISNKANVSNAAYVLNAQVYGSAVATGAYGAGSGNGIITNGQINGMRAVDSAHLGLVAGKGTAIFGDFTKVLATLFGVVAIKRDDLTKLADGTVILQGSMYMDSKTRSPKSLVKDSLITL